MTTNERVTDKRLAELTDHYAQAENRGNGWWIALHWALRELQERRAASAVEPRDRSRIGLASDDLHWLQRAVEILDEDASALRDSHTINGEWDEDEPEVREHWVEMQEASRAVLEARRRLTGRAHETSKLCPHGRDSNDCIACGR